MSKVTKALKADLPALAELLRQKGKNQDTILAHINPREAALLKRHGGSGDINPDTGLPQYDDTLTDIGVSQAQQDAPLPTDQSAMPTEAPQFAPPTQNQQEFARTQEAADVAAGPSAGAIPTGQQLATGATAFAPTNTPFTAADLQRLSTGQVPEQPSFVDKAGAALGNVTTQQLVKALGIGGLGVLGARNAGIAGTQNQQALDEQRQIAKPYQTQGQELVGAAQRGELTPQSQQAFQAAMAQANQSVANRGGVGQQQVQMQMADLYNRLLNNQYTYGLQILQLGDNIALGAIKQGLQLDRGLQQTTQNFYAQLAAIASGSTLGGTKQGITANG